MRRTRGRFSTVRAATATLPSARYQTKASAAWIPPNPNGIRSQFLRSDPTYLLTRDGAPSMQALSEATWIGGCERCTEHLTELCRREGFHPRIQYSTDDMVTIQALVAAGMGAAIMPGIALQAHRRPDIVATEIPGAQRHIYLATYGDPPDPPPIAALRAALDGM